MNEISTMTIGRDERRLTSNNNKNDKISNETSLVESNNTLSLPGVVSYKDSRHFNQAECVGLLRGKKISFIKKTTYPTSRT